MKEEVKRLLKGEGKEFNEDIYSLSLRLMHIVKSIKGSPVSEYLKLDPLNRAEYIARHWDSIIKIKNKEC